MKWNKKKIRMVGFDYSDPGKYFVTICTKDQIDFFGKIEAGKMILNDIGRIAHEFWLDIPKHFPHTRLHEFVIMPNHMHGIIELCEQIESPDESKSIYIPSVGAPLLDLNNQTERGKNLNQSIKPYYQKLGKLKSGCLGVIVQQYKSSVKRWCNNSGYENFQWHSRYYDRIIRDEEAYRRVSLYIENNVKNYK